MEQTIIQKLKEEKTGEKVYCILDGYEHACIIGIHKLGESVVECVPIKDGIDSKVRRVSGVEPDYVGEYVMYEVL